MMTAAMAFFSIALTLNLAGIKLTQLRPADFQPSRLRANLTRQYYSTNEQVTKYYENLRLVYEMESRVRELRRTTEAEPSPSPQQTPKRQRATAAAAPVRPSPRGQQIPPARTAVRATKACRARGGGAGRFWTVEKRERFRRRFSGLCR